MDRVDTAAKILCLKKHTSVRVNDGVTSHYTTVGFSTMNTRAGFYAFCGDKELNCVVIPFFKNL